MIYVKHKNTLIICYKCGACTLYLKERERRESGGTRKNVSPVLKVLRQCPLNLLVEVCLRGSEAYILSQI
jgi:hypothetical protein